MSEAKIIDARGLSCPEPAMLTREALLSMNKGKLVILSDSLHPAPMLSGLESFWVGQQK